LVGDAFGSRYEFKKLNKLKKELEYDNYQTELKGEDPPINDTVLNNRNYIIINDNIIKLDANQYIGLIGLCLSIVLKEFIKNNGNIIKIMSNICSYGGDTDTNCCIGGVLFGAFYVDTLPSLKSGDSVIISFWFYFSVLIIYIFEVNLQNLPDWLKI